MLFSCLFAPHVGFLLDKHLPVTRATFERKRGEVWVVCDRSVPGCPGSLSAAWEFGRRAGPARRGGAQRAALP